MSAPNTEPYEQAYYPPVPTKLTKYSRTSIIWQLYRFFVINYKTLKVVAKSHPKQTMHGGGYHTGHAATRTALRSGRRMSSTAGPHRSLSASERS